MNFIRAASAPAVAETNQFLDYDDALHTLELSRASVRFADLSSVRIKELSKLKILQRTDGTNGPTFRLDEGQLYISSRGGRVTIPVQTPHVKGTPRGTEFLVAVDAQAQRTEITMFDGEVVMSGPADPQPVTVRSGQQGITMPGQRTQVVPILQAQNIVQWWIYYPGVLDPTELALTPVEEAELAPSLAAYRDGDLQAALRLHPGYPTPPEPATDARRVYLAGLLLAVGAVDRAGSLLNRATVETANVRALRQMIRAVSGGTSPERTQSSHSASSLLALSYAHQSTNNLRAALAVARAAVARSTNFGFGWARVAELEFSFGQTRAAREAVQRGLELAPRNAQAHAVNGFLLAAQYRFNKAIESFNEAIRLDPALGNAWLGRGLCLIRKGEASAGRSDLQTAAILEPSRSLVRSYAGKAFGDAGEARLATRELDFARQLDANDPTPWLYLALQAWHENRVNEAVRDLERSSELNDNRAVYRSRLLLDQDHATRSASLAKIYQDAGLGEVALREAARAVSYDYSSHSAHQFLAESYNALRDPTRFNLRYETVWFNELLLANILSPVGAGLLSQNISQQEYASLFEQNRLGLTTSTEVRSDGQYREIASHYGLLDRFSYTLDLDYQHNNGTRPNNDLDRIEWYSQFKYQVTDRDSVLLLTKYQDYESGDSYQRYEPATASTKLRLTEEQAPLLVGALHREWAPGNHTTLLGGRLDSELAQRDYGPRRELFTNGTGITEFRSGRFGELDYRSRLDIYLAEVNQLLELRRHTLVAGARLQLGDIEARDTLDRPLSSAGTVSGVLSNVYQPFPIGSNVSEPFRRLSLYGYDTVELGPQFLVTIGVAYDDVMYPKNFRDSPVSAGREHQGRVSPKAAVVWELPSVLAFRAIYSQGFGGASLDESFRLEPTQLAGFSQAYRQLFPESEVGTVSVPRNEIVGVALDWKSSAATYFGIRADQLKSRIDHDIGVFYRTGLPPPPRQAFAGRTLERLDYEERSLSLSVDQLIGTEWSIGARYAVTGSELDRAYPAIPSTATGNPSRKESALLHQVGFQLKFNHASGLFAQLHSQWLRQEHGEYTSTRPGESLYQVDMLTGYRFWRRRGELTLGCLNLTDQDYRISSLTPYPDLPRERVWFARARLHF